MRDRGAPPVPACAGAAWRGRGRVLTLLAPILLASAPRGLAAQEIERPPLAPDSVLTAGPREAGFAEWRDRVARQGRSGVSFLVEGERYGILVLTPMAVDALAPDSLTVRASRGCQRALQVTDSLVEATGEVRPWVAFDSATRARPVVALAVLPAERRRYDCHAGLAARFAALARGLQYGAFAPYAPEHDVGRAELRRDGFLEPAVLSGRAAVTQVTEVRAVRDGSAQLRLYIDPAAFAPAPDGRLPRLEVHVWNLVDPEPEVLPIPDQVIRAVWQQLLPWRAMQLAADVASGAVAREGATSAPLALPAPRDPALRAAHARYEAGDLAASSAEALDRLTRWPLPPRREIRGAMLQAAAVFTTYGEGPAMTSLLADVLEVYPCLTFAAEAPASMREAAELLRPEGARCTGTPLPVIALRSAVPGWGQLTTPGRRKLALAVLGSTAGAYLLANRMHAYAEREYADYRAYAGYGEPYPEAIWKNVELGRTVGNVAMIAGATLWSAAALEAVWHEWRHHRALADVREVGRRTGDARAAGRPAPRVSPLLTPGAVGLAVRF